MKYDKERRNSVESTWKKEPVKPLWANRKGKKRFWDMNLLSVLNLDDQTGTLALTINFGLIEGDNSKTFTISGFQTIP